jgi:hypothetical protein
MLRIVLWALATGFVSGVVWFAILFLRKHPPHAAEPPVLPESAAAEAMTLQSMTQRLLALEARLDATEHALKRERMEQSLRPPRTSHGDPGAGDRG